MTNSITALLAAMALVESGDNCNAIGDHGRAVGHLQIHAGALSDVNRIAGTRYRLSDMRNRRLAEWVAARYMRHYAGPGASAEKMARTFNGGPDGPRERVTLRYWRRVRNAMAQNSK